MAESPAGTAQPAQRPKPNYMLIFLVLAVLTVIELAASFTITTRLLLVVLLILLATSKAGLVVAYYMHLRFERAPLRVIALGPLVLVILLTVVLLLERSTLAR